GIAVVEDHALTQLELPGFLIHKLPRGGQPRGQIELFIAQHQVVIEIEEDVDIRGGGTVVGIKMTDVSALPNDQVAGCGPSRQTADQHQSAEPRHRARPATCARPKHSFPPLESSAWPRGHAAPKQSTTHGLMACIMVE